MTVQSHSARPTPHMLDVAEHDPGPGSEDPGGSPRRLGARVGAAAALAVAVWFHVGVAVDHLHEVPYLGWSFVAYVVLAAAIAGSLLVESRTAAWVAAFVLSVATLALYGVSRAVGLPGAGDDVGDWSNSAGIICATAEIVVAIVSFAILLTRTHQIRRAR